VQGCGFSGFVSDAGIKKPGNWAGLAESFYQQGSIVAVVATIAAVAVSTAAAASAEATAAAATAEASLLEATATTPFGLGTAFIDHDVAAIHFAAVEGCDSGLCLVAVGHFHETKALAPVGEFVQDDFGRRDFAVLGEQIAQVLIFQVPTDVSYVNVHFERFKKIKSVNSKQYPVNIHSKM
jgi:hypothetical protein